MTRWASAVMTVVSSLTHAVRAKARPWAARVDGFDVEVVQHLEMVGDEADRADEHAPRVTVGGEFVDDLQDIGPQPRLRRAAGALPGDAPVVPAAAPATHSPSPAARPDRDRRVEDSLGKRVRGEQHCVSSGQRGEARRDVGSDELDERRFGRPTLDLGTTIRATQRPT